MESKANTLIKVPNSIVIKPTDEITITKIFKTVIKELLIESIGDYFNSTYIDYKLDEIVKIEMNKNINYIGDTIFEIGTLKLPDYFFTREIKSKEDLINLITEYPALKDLLTTYGIYIVSFNKQDTEENQIIKNIIATFFATENSHNELTDITYANMTFQSKATSYASLENIIREISLIFEKNILYVTLKSDNNVLIRFIDEKTQKKGLGKEFISCFISLYESCKNERIHAFYLDYTDYIVEEKLMPFYQKIKDFDIDTQETILKLIQIKDYDLSAAKLVDENIDLSDIESLTDFEKKLIKSFISTFDDYWHIFKQIIVGYPPTKHIGRDSNGDKIYDGKSFSFLNKVFSSHLRLEDEHTQICKEIQEKWIVVQEIIIWEILPKYIKNNPNKNIDLDEILLLSKFEGTEKTYNISKKFKTKKLERKIQRGKKRKS